MNKTLKYGLWLIVSGYGALSLYPFFILLFQSLKTENEVWGRPFALPREWIVSNFATVWSKANFEQYALNSVFVTAVTLALSLLFGTMLGYALSRMSFFARKLHFALLMGVLLVPSSLLIVPVYVLSDSLGILNTHLGLILPYLASGIILPTILMKSVFDTVPKELFDAASIDGCGEYRMLFRIMAPIGLPMMATLSILLFRMKWNEYIWAQVSIRDENLFTLPVGMANLAATVHNVGYGTVYAGMTLLTIPILILFFSAQKWFLGAVTAGAVKG